MANQDDFERILNADTPEARLYNRAICSAEAPWPVRAIAGVVYIDCALWQASLPTDIVQIDEKHFFDLMESGLAHLVDPALIYAYARSRNVHRNGSTVVERNMINRMMRERFAVYFSNVETTPGNIRGEMLELQVIPTDIHVIATARRDGTPITQPA